jgi:choline-sulfatase
VECTTVNGYGPQLFDLEKDPGETINLAGRKDMTTVEKQLHIRAERNWDGAGLKTAVLTSQSERGIVQSSRKLAQARRWDDDPVTAGPYGRAL